MNDRFRDDMQAQFVSGPPRYFFGAQGPVFAAPIVRDGETVAYVFHGSVDEPEAAGIVSRNVGDFQPRGSGHWSQILQKLRASNVPAAEGVRSLLGAQGPDYAGRIGDELFEYRGKAELQSALNPEQVDAVRVRTTARKPGVSPQEVDAGLRGGAPLTPEVRQAVERIDTALAVKPTPEAIVVVLTSAVAVIPADLETGSRVYEPSFLTTWLAGSDNRFPGQSPVVYLRVPAGIPALFIAPSSPDRPGRLLLGRGIEWEVMRVFEMDGQLIVTGAIVALHPAALS